jgi:hypothetical protein
MHQLIRKYSSLLVILWLLVSLAMAQTKPVELNKTSEGCLKCHSQNEYSFQNPVSGSTEKKQMNPLVRIDSLKFKECVHSNFSCTDCHSPDYATFPHNIELKKEYLNTCQDCHVGDKAYAHFQFDEIEEQARNSIHAKKMGDAFKCEICHSPHTTKLVANSGKYSLHDLVAYSNNLCMSCHDDANRYRQFTDSLKPDFHEIHEWLPNQSLHFKHVRCIECHTSKSDTLKVAHLILPKEEAIKGCIECHSENGFLEAKLFKYLSKEPGIIDGIPATTKNKMYIIGTHKNQLLTKVSLIIFGLALAAILIHIIARMIKRKRND